MANYAFTKGRDLPQVENGHTFERLNFTQKEPHTPIFQGITGLTFRKCNLINCDVPADSVIDDCLHVHVEFCSNVHPGWIEKGLSLCAENCSHVVDTDEIRIDGILIDTIYHCQDKVVS